MLILCNFAVATTINVKLMASKKIDNLIIVESPAKAATIQKFLGAGYTVMSSKGHVRDLASANMGVNVDEGFRPVYEIPAEKMATVSELRRAAASAQQVWLASDEDREGEAIAWHLTQVLGLDPVTTPRIVFHEITKAAVTDALAHPRTIDMRRVDAQQARRVLDRIVGFELSPVLWRKIRPALSAGRVQSVAVRLIVEREAEIQAFKPEGYWRLTGRLATPEGAEIKAEMTRRLTSRPKAEEALEACKGGPFVVSDVKATQVRRQPAAPFTTSTMQQEANRRLGMSVSQTMAVAQRLYENGLITYMRTDSLNLSTLALTQIAGYVNNTYGPQAYKLRRYHTTSKGAQEAHEAIRPTDCSNPSPKGLEGHELRLYQLIWRRAVASQMADALIDKTTVEAVPQLHPEADVRLTATGEVVAQEGFLRVYGDAEQADMRMLPPMRPGELLTPLAIVATERYTQHPASYNEAALVKKMEDLGIGRPSTYATTISTIQARGYVEKGDRPGRPRNFMTLTLDPITGKISETSDTENAGAEKSRLLPTDTGMVVNEFLTQYFPNILDYSFTANVEEGFDKIAEGQKAWNDSIGEFYGEFHPSVDAAANMQLEHKVGERVLGKDPKTGETVSVKIGRFGPMVQIGDTSAEVKPRFASLQKGQSIATITLEEALKLFAYPRHLGQFEDKEITVSIGRFGPYVYHAGKYASIPKEFSPATLTYDEAVAIILAHRQAEADKLIKAFDEAPDIQILKGRWGPFIKQGRTNYKIPKTVTDASALTLEEVRTIMEHQEAKPTKRRTRK